jgi:transposase InsO family protein
MPWKETCAMCERGSFIDHCRRGELTVAELCRSFGISRKTGYKWLTRHHEEGLAGLADRSRARRTQEHAVSDRLVLLILDARSRHPTWGAKKLVPYLARRHPRIRSWPALSTVGEILRRHGLTRPRRGRPPRPELITPCLRADGPNDVWTMDFKGYFRTLDGRACWPLTIADAFSRRLLGVTAMARPRGDWTRAACERAFRACGVPRVIRTDNGEPFAGSGIGRLSRLSVWWMKQRIRVDRIDPGKPQQNGRHERMHGVLKQETALPPAASLPAQQRRFDRFVPEYNDERPHEALGGRVPSELWRPSPRRYEEHPAGPSYPAHWEKRAVKKTGLMKWRGAVVYVGEPLWKETVGLEEIDDGLWRLDYYETPLAVLDERREDPVIRPIRAPGPRAVRS